MEMEQRCPALSYCSPKARLMAVDLCWLMQKRRIRRPQLNFPCEFHETLIVSRTAPKATARRLCKRASLPSSTSPFPELVTHSCCSQSACGTLHRRNCLQVARACCID